jgi:hypothetical protein
VDVAALRGMLPPVFIPSKGRAGHPSGTVALLLESGVPFTIVVEPQDAAAYREWLTDRECKLTVLPKNDQGVSYARNHILSHLVGVTDRWVWIMDDDIRCFRQKCPGAVGTGAVSPWVVFQAVAPAAAVDPSVALMGLEYDQFAFSAKQEWTINSYTNVCVLLDTHALRAAAVRYRGRVREDYDLSLQCITRGLKTQRARQLSVRVPGMGRLTGGMRDYYTECRGEIVAANAAFVERWYPLCELQVKGAEARPDIRVKWSLLSRLLPLYTFYQKQRRKAQAKANRRATATGGERSPAPEEADPRRSKRRLPTPTLPKRTRLSR